MEILNIIVLNGDVIQIFYSFLILMFDVQNSLSDKFDILRNKQKILFNDKEVQVFGFLV